MAGGASFPKTKEIDAIAFLGGATGRRSALTERSKAFTTSEDPKADATSGSSTSAIAPSRVRLSSGSSGFDRDCQGARAPAHPGASLELRGSVGHGQ
ncbi:MAG TPA: hypothetical protein VEO02_02510 [Thermoanaerobaculia bacterium]|nr:hypothetical protein [Thermoanaerobaculia bacterium]